MALHAVQGNSLVRQAMDAVHGFIRDQGLRVGDTLPGEAHFAGQLGVSRAVMREAFGGLAALRLIDVGNGRRARVAAIDGSVMATSLDHAIGTAQISVLEVWEVRRTLEARTAELAAVNRSDAEAAEIVALADSIERDIDDMAAITRHDIAFHRAIARAAGNALLTQIIQSFGPLMQIAVPAAWRTRKTAAEQQAIIRQHQQLAAAIMDRDAARAAHCMHGHFDASVASTLANTDA
ncbi:FadR/GntR family transcriptional regulator [Glacieibacterium frigidum]|uniref:FadR family transcriptional regulator n=1 Tax=Glacieibacterium frigidum TaxID=2593303 RepID=A0A552U7E3_9SPHN|nr:FCD domain-containing protein [Glacieibacterium frigidum]TRW14136.1 FadR family transcriptional regulator [Glacieibacterium frigidum]